MRRHRHGWTSTMSIILVLYFDITELTVPKYIFYYFILVLGNVDEEWHPTLYSVIVFSHFVKERYYEYFNVSFSLQILSEVDISVWELNCNGKKVSLINLQFFIFLCTLLSEICFKIIMLPERFNIWWTPYKIYTLRVN